MVTFPDEKISCQVLKSPFPKYNKTKTSFNLLFKFQDSFLSEKPGLVFDKHTVK